MIKRFHQLKESQNFVETGVLISLLALDVLAVVALWSGKKHLSR